MKKIKKLIFLSVLVLVTPIYQGLSIDLCGLVTIANKPIISAIKDPKILGECGCYLQLPSDRRNNSNRYIFFSDVFDNALMNIDGKDTKLKLLSNTETKGEPKKGDRSKSIYAAGNTKVQVDYIVTDVCDPKDLDCEVTNYAATITVIRGDRQQVVTIGNCGC